MLDESSARIILLIAPAGYGKTTLAHEWFATGSNHVAWYRSGPASTDLAALAAGVAKATAEIVPGAGTHMRERLRTVTSPEEDAPLLAEMLGEDLAGWPRDAWLAIDDYHFALGARPSEEFVSALALITQLRLVICSRRRPSWATARQRLYGDLVELDRLDLAMTHDEAREVLGRGDEVNAVLAQAGGWAAALGLAAVSGGRLSSPEGEMPSALYDYLAEELYNMVDPASQEALCRVALVPAGRLDLAERLLGAEIYDVVLSALTRLGLPFLGPAGEPELHPLFRSFLERKLRDRNEQELRALAGRVGSQLLALGQWDEVYAIARRFDHDALLLDLLNKGTDVMMEEGRLTTVSEWLLAAEERNLVSPMIDVVEAEVALRQGEYDKVEALCEHALQQWTHPGSTSAKALTLAGRAAHLAGRDTRALEYHRQAHLIATSDAQKQAALWGQCLSLLDLEQPGAETLLDEFSTLGGGSADDALRLATAACHLRVKQGVLVPREVLNAIHLLSRVKDQMVRSAFLNAYGGFLTFEGHYARGLEIARLQVDEALALRLHFALPHAYMRQAAALTGLRRFSDAHGSIDKAEALSDGSSDPHLMPVIAIARASVHISSGASGHLGEISERKNLTILASLDGELLATRALAKTALGEHQTALTLARLALARTNAVEPQTLATFALALTSQTAGQRQRTNLIRQAIRAALSIGNVNGFILAYRCCPTILKAAVGEADDLGLREILLRARDEGLARSCGLRIHRDGRRGSGLTKREQEVFDLLAEGRTNREIGSALFISEATVKVHVRRIMEKAGARTRTEAVTRWADRQEG